MHGVRATAQRRSAPGRDEALSVKAGRARGALLRMQVFGMFSCADRPHITQTSPPRCLLPPGSRRDAQHGDPMDPRRALRAAADRMPHWSGNQAGCRGERSAATAHRLRRCRRMHGEGWTTAAGRPHADSALHRAVRRCRQDLHRQQRLQRRLPGHQHRADRRVGRRYLSARQRSLRLPPDGGRRQGPGGALHRFMASTMAERVDGPVSRSARGRRCRQRPAA